MELFQWIVHAICSGICVRWQTLQSYRSWGSCLEYGVHCYANGGRVWALFSPEILASFLLYLLTMYEIHFPV